MSNAAAAIRIDLKAAGFSLKSFSIRSCRTGSVTVEIRDLAIAKARITEIACKHEKIDRDGSGEILSGGNTFVSVRYADAAIAAAGAPLTARLRADESRFGGIHLDTTGSHTWHVWTNGSVGRHLRQISPFDGEALAEILADRGELAAVLAAAPEAAPAAPAAPAEAPGDSAELAARLERIESARELLRRALGELDTGATVETVKDADAAISECESLLELVARELDC